MFLNLRITALAAKRARARLSNYLVTRARRAYASSPALDLVALDQKWQTRWASQKLKNAAKKKPLGKTGGPKSMYILPMFPYPSGNLHLGHLRVYTIADVLARFGRMKGHEVLHPMGWDAFGLPAENAAMERGIDPAEWTRQNIANMKAQLQSMNGDWDWDREFATCDPGFYKHTQRIFLMLHECGLVYQDESLVNYDPVDKTVLANEQVDANGRSWRSGAKVEKRMLKQWFLRISAFRQSLLDDLDLLAEKNLWPERVLSMQRNWIGKSEGVRIKFHVSSELASSSVEEAVDVFTTRPDTLFGVQFLALATTHPLVMNLAETHPELRRFCHEITPTLPQDSKAAFRLDNIYAVNPLSRDQSLPDTIKETLPIFVAPYVLGDYGSGAVMGVPGHDARDHAFWKENCSDSPIRTVIQPSVDESVSSAEHEPTNPPTDGGIFSSRGVLTSQCGPFAGQASTVAAQNIIAKLNEQGDEVASVVETWRLRDWLISRQRYWGTPIPIIHCPSCGPRPVPTAQLPVELPPVESHWLKGKSGNPLEQAHDWVRTKCPDCGRDAKRDTDTMDTFVDSSWYYMRFPDAHNDDLPFSPAAAATHLPVDLYIGGVEHAILHLLYARFIHKFLATTPLWPAAPPPREPFHRLIAQGMVHGKTYTDPATGRFLAPPELDLSVPTSPRIAATGGPAHVRYEKMSKSKHNGVAPSASLAAHGADATRAHILFQAPLGAVLDWDDAKIAGIRRWLARLHDRVVHFATTSGLPKSTTSADWPRRHFARNLGPAATAPPPGLRADIDCWRAVQRTILSVTHSFTVSFALNTVISDLMSLTNVLVAPDARACRAELQYHALAALLKMSAPITPAFAEECWEILHASSVSSSFPRSPSDPGDGADAAASIFQQAFPAPDGTLEMLGRRAQTCAVQVNGRFKVAFDIPVAPEGMEGAELEAWVVEQILRSGRVARFGVERAGFEGERKWTVIVVKGGKTVNFVSR